MELTKTKLLQLLSHQTRMSIIEVLFDGDANVSEIVDKTNLDQSLVSHHLAVLRKYKIAYSKVDGKSRVYFLNHKTIGLILKTIDEHLEILGDE